MADRAHSRRGASRRAIIAGAGGLTIAAMAGCTVVPATEVTSNGAAEDLALLDNLLGLEYEAVAAYDAALAGGAFGTADAARAHAFQGDHVKHAEALAHDIARLHGKPVAQRPARDYRFSSAALKEPTEALRFLVGFERGLALAHLGAVPAFADRTLAKRAASILAIETMHWSALRLALGEEAVPAPFLG